MDLDRFLPFRPFTRKSNRFDYVMFRWCQVKKSFTVVTRGRRRRKRKGGEGVGEEREEEGGKRRNISV